jgi:hypothetical protein
MKHKLLLALIFMPVFLMAQGVVYLYDAAGNRTSRAYVVNLRSAPSSEAPTPDSIQVAVELGPFAVTIYPNPTKGALAIAVTGLTESELLSLGLFDPNGRQLMLFDVPSGTSSLDLSTYPSGWYLLRARSKGKTVHFKIIKQ